MARKKNIYVNWLIHGANLEISEILLNHNFYEHCHKTHIFWPRNLVFGLNDPWDMRKKRIFLFLEILIFTLFIGIFRFFSLYNICNIFFKLPVTVFHLGIFGLIRPFTIKNRNFWFFKYFFWKFIFTFKGANFPFFRSIFKI